MNNKVSSFSAVLGAAFMASTALVPGALAADTTFAAQSLSTGYTLAENTEGKCGEAKCGADKGKTHEEGKCGEGKCGTDKEKAEGKCGTDKEKAEGKCGEGKCGADSKKGEAAANNSEKANAE